MRKTANNVLRMQPVSSKLAPAGVTEGTDGLNAGAVARRPRHGALKAWLCLTDAGRLSMLMLLATQRCESSWLFELGKYCCRGSLKVISGIRRSLGLG